MKTRRTCALLLALVLSLSLCGCGASSSSPSMREQSSAASGYMPEPAPMMMNAAYDMAFEDGGFGMMASAKTESTVGGFIESSSVNGSNYYDSARGYTSRRSATYTLRIPSEKFAGIMSNLSTFGNVPYTYTYTENVTAQYYDVQARLKALQAQEKRLLEMMEIAETVEDIITIEDKLTDVRYRIDAQQTSLNNWDRRVSYSTLNLTVKEVQVYTPEKVTKITYGEELWRAFTDALRNAGQFFKDLLVFLVSSIPTLVILAALFFVFRPLLKKLFGGIKARREARSAKKSAKKDEAIQDAKIEEEKKQ